MISFTIDGIKRLGEHDAKYGSRFWATTPDGGLPLMFNVMDADFGDNIENGPFQIVAEEKSERESAKGTPYLMLKKVKLVESAQKEAAKPANYLPAGSRDVPSSATSPSEQLDRIELLLQEIDSKLDELRGI